MWILSVGLSALGVAVSGYTGTLIFMFLMLVLNDQAAVRLNMFNGQISSIFAFKKVAPLAWMSRWFVNSINAFAGPILFTIYPPLPFYVASGVTVFWTAILVVAFRMRVKTVNDVIERKILSRS